MKNREEKELFLRDKALLDYILEQCTKETLVEDISLKGNAEEIIQSKHVSTVGHFKLPCGLHVYMSEQIDKSIYIVPNEVKKEDIIINGVHNGITGTQAALFYTLYSTTLGGNNTICSIEYSLGNDWDGESIIIAGIDHNREEKDGKACKTVEDSYIFTGLKYRIQLKQLNQLDARYHDMIEVVSETLRKGLEGLNGKEISNFVEIFVPLKLKLQQARNELIGEAIRAVYYNRKGKLLPKEAMKEIISFMDKTPEVSDIDKLNQQDGNRSIEETIRVLYYSLSGRLLPKEAMKEIISFIDKMPEITITDEQNEISNAFLVKYGQLGNSQQEENPQTH